LGDLLLRIVGIVFPIFGIVVAGYAYARYKAAHGGVDMRFANQLNMDIFVPALVFAALASRDFNLLDNLPLALGALAVVLGSGLLALPLARLLKVDSKTFVPPMMFTNSGNMGLPLAVLAFGEKALPLAVVMFFVENVMHYSLGTWMLDHKARLLTLWKNPVIAASLAGLVFALFKLPLWQPLYVAVKMLGDVSIPLLLFSLGVRLMSASLTDVRLGLIGAIACPLFGMAVAWAITPMLGLSGLAADLLLVFGALPPAVLNFVFAETYRHEPQRVASLVMLGNLGALLFVPIALAVVLK
jgi:malate permease and related proteins